jgi:hypothetical protein
MTAAGFWDPDMPLIVIDVTPRDLPRSHRSCVLARKERKAKTYATRPWSDLTQWLTRLMFWRRRTPSEPQTALFLDAEFQIMLMELHYPPIVRGVALGPHTRRALSSEDFSDEFQFHCLKRDAAEASLSSVRSSTGLGVRGARLRAGKL